MKELFVAGQKELIGMVHVRALPGTPRNGLSVAEICRVAVEEARVLREAGFDAVLLENMHDLPYLKRAVGAEVTAAMTAAACAVRGAVDCPVGIQVLAGANREALAVAHAAGAQFIRAEGFVFAHVADEGLMESDAGELLRYRRAIGAECVKVFADIKKKHSSHALTADVSLADTAHAAEFFGADAVIVTGSATGREAADADLAAVSGATALPVIVGSGTTPDTLARQWELARGFIVGSWIKEDARWDHPIDPARAREMVRTAERLR
jgi:hypothetical protein